MPEEFEINVESTLEALVKRIEAAPKPLALAISPCAYNKEQACITCRIDFFNACALLTGAWLPDREETKVLIIIDDRKVGTMPIGILTAMACLLFQLPLCGLAFVGPNPNWGFIVAIIVVPVLLLLAFIPISKHLLKLFVRKIILNESSPT